MSGILSKDLNLALSIKKGVKEHYNRDKHYISLVFEDGNENDEKYYLTYKDYDRLRLIMVNILNLIFHDIKNGKRKHMKKVIRLINIFNYTYSYFHYPNDEYLYRFQIFVKDKLFNYYKDYIYKAQMEYYYKKELPWPSCIAFNEYGIEEDYNPTQLKFIYDIFRRDYVYLMKYYNNLNN